MIEDRAIVAQVLSAIRRDLGLVVQPELQSPQARVRAMMMSDMLGHLIAWHREEADTADERQRFEAHFAIAGEEKQQSADRLQGLEVDVTPARLEAFLHARLPGWDGAVADTISRVAAGYSKDTFLFRATRQGTALDGVIRRDLPFGPGENSVLDEYELLRALHAAGLPLAEPLWREADLAWLGQPFIISRRMPGRDGTDAWDQDESARRGICLQLAGILGRLHSVDPAIMGVPSRGDPADHIRAYVTQWRDRWQRHRVHASPTLEAAFGWLLENVPANVARLAVVHSDVGFHNILTENGRITALLDWEFSHPGDPAEDLGYCRLSVEKLMPWNQFLAAYEAAGGAPYSEDSAKFYEVWRGVRNAVCCSVAWNGFLRDWYPALKMGYQGVPLYRRFVLDVADRLERATA